MLRLVPSSLLSVLRRIPIGAAILVLVLPNIAVAGHTNHNGHPAPFVAHIEAELCAGKAHCTSGLSSEACCSVSCQMSLPASSPELGPGSTVGGHIEVGPERKSGVEPDGVRRPPKLLVA